MSVDYRQHHGREAIDVSSVVDVQQMKASVRAQLFGEPEQPVHLGRFRLLRRLGVGGTGSVYVAHDEELGRAVAIKFLHGLIADDEVARGRIQREARTLAGCTHPNIVTIYEVGAFANHVFIAMELVDGVDMRRWLRAHHRTPPEILAAFVQAGRGLSAAHSRGVVHRDFKPENVVVDGSGVVKIVDFGLAGSPEVNSGAAEGTPGYIAPERMRGAPGDERSDQYSFCVSLYEALYGRLPGSSPSFPARQRVPRRLVLALRRGLELDPADRFADMDALLRVLAPRPSPWRRAAAGLIPAALLTASVAAMVHERSCPDPARALEGVWDRQRRGDIEARFAASDMDHADATWNQVAQRIDAHAQQWTELQRQTCVWQQQSEAEPHALRRAACLTGALQELRALSDLLVEGERRTLEASPAAVNSLTPLTRCDDRRFLRMQVDLPPEPAARSEVTRARAELARGRTFVRLGNFEAALAIADETLSAAQRLAYRPLEAEAHALRAVALDDAQESCVDALHDMLIAAQASGHDELVALALAMLVGVGPDDVGLQMRRAEAAIERIGGHAEAEGIALANLAVAKEDQDEWEEARQTWRRAVERMEAAGNEALAAAYRFNVAELDVLGGAEDALAELEQAFARMLQIHGPGHLRVARAMRRLGQQVASVDPERGFALIEDGAERLQRTLPAGHEENITATLTRFEAAMLRGDHEEALAHAVRLEGIAVASSEPDAGVWIGAARVARATAGAELGLLQTDELLTQARPHLESCRIGAALCMRWRRRLLDLQAQRAAQRGECRESLTLLEQLEREQAGTVVAVQAQFLNRLVRARVLLRCGRPHDALAVLDAEQDLSDAVSFMVLLGEVKLALGEPERARELLLKVQARSEATGLWVPPELWFDLARATLPKDPTAARTLAMRAVEGYVELGSGRDPDRLRVEKWLAEHG